MLQYGSKKGLLLSGVFKMWRWKPRSECELLEDFLADQLADHLDVLRLTVRMSEYHAGYDIALYNPHNQAVGRVSVTIKTARSPEFVSGLVRLASRMKNQTHSKLAKYLRGESCGDS
jgi:precorrin-3B methylase